MALLLALAVRLRFHPLLAADQWAVDKATDLTRRSAPLRTALDDWQWLALPSHVYLVAAVVCVIAARRRAVFPLLVMPVGWLLATLTKVLVARPRPAHAVDLLSGYAFPSGHVTNLAVAATTVVLVLGRGRWLAALLLVITGLDRVLLGVHFPSDVIGGWCLGTGIVLAAYAAQTSAYRARAIE